MAGRFRKKPNRTIAALVCGTLASMLPGCGYTQPDVQEAKRLEAEHMRYFRAWSARDDKCMNGLVPDPDTVSSEAFANAQKICEAYVPYPPEAVAAEQRYRIARDACWRAHPGDNACPEWHTNPVTRSAIKLACAVRRPFRTASVSTSFGGSR